MGLHPASRVHRVTPQVVAEPACSNHAGHDRAGIHADANRQRLAARVDAPGYLLAHRQSHLSHRIGVVGARVGQAPNDHIGVTDRLDLLQPSLLGESVEH
jgi:hypothetical protein